MRTIVIAKPLALLSAVVSMAFAPASPPFLAQQVGTATVCANPTICCPQVGSACHGGGKTYENYVYSDGQCS